MEFFIALIAYSLGRASKRCPEEEAAQAEADRRYAEREAEKDRRYAAVRAAWDAQHPRIVLTRKIAGIVVALGALATFFVFGSHACVMYPGNGLSLRAPTDLRYQIYEGPVPITPPVSPFSQEAK